MRVRGRKDERLLWLPAHSDPPSDGSITAHRGLCVRAMSFEMLSFCFKLGLIDTDASVLRGYYAQPEERE